MNDMVSWGIIGSGNIARRFAQSLAHEPHARLMAVSGRDQGHLEVFAKNIPQSPDLLLGYQRLLERDDIDIVYIALPHGLHEEWACKALMAEKNVLCEKPAGLTKSEVEHMIYVARQTGQLFVEGMKARFEPIHAALAEALGKYDLGSVLSVESLHRVPIKPERGGYIIDARQGGLLLDVGIYGASWIEEFLPGEIKLDNVEVGYEQGVDWYDDARLHIGGVPARLYVEGSSNNTSMLTVKFERGKLELETIQRPQAAKLYIAGLAAPITLEAPYVFDDFTGEISHVCSLVLSGATESDIMPYQSSIRMAEILDTIRHGFGRN